MIVSITQLRQTQDKGKTLTLFAIVNNNISDETKWKIQEEKKNSKTQNPV